MDFSYKQYIGIDFGSGNCTIAVSDGSGHTDSILAENSTGKLRALIACENSVILIGNEAENFATIHADRALLYPKIFIGLDYDEMKSTSTDLQLPMLPARLEDVSFWKIGDPENSEFQHLSTRQAITYLFAGLRDFLSPANSTSSTKTAITIPSSFTVDQKEQVKLAATTAGFPDVRCVPETLAILLTSLTHMRLDTTKKILVLNVGAYFSEAALYVVRSPTVIEILDVKKCGDVSGVHLDLELIAFIAQRALREEGITLDESVRQRLRLRCEQAKINLSSQPFTSVWVPGISHSHAFHRVSRSQFRELCQPTWQRLSDIVRRLIEESSTTADLDNVGDIIISGGCSRIPGLVSQLKSTFRDHPITVAPDHFASHGAALWAEKGWVVENNIAAVPSEPDTGLAVLLEPFVFDVEQFNVADTPVTTAAAEVTRTGIVDLVRNRLGLRRASNARGRPMTMGSDNVVRDVVSWLRENNTVLDLLKTPCLSYDGAIDAGGPYRDGMHRIFTAFSEYEHADFGGPLFAGEGLKLVSNMPAICEESKEVLRSLGKMLFYGFVHGNAWAVWLPKFIFRSWFSIPYDRNVVHGISPFTGQLVSAVMAASVTDELASDENFSAWAESRNFFDMRRFSAIPRIELAKFIVDEDLIERRLVNMNLIREGFSQGGIDFDIKHSSRWPDVESLLYSTVTTAEEFLCQFLPSTVSNLSVKHARIWTWFQTYLRGCDVAKLECGLRFLTGCVFIPTPNKIKVQFMTGTTQVPRLPFARTCSGYLELDDRFESEQQMHQALDHCFVSEQRFGRA